MDFAHNPQALQALLDMANRLEPARKALCFGQAGDRPDDLIRELARSAWQSGLDKVFVSELAKYHRGREPGAVYTVIRDELLKCGARRLSTTSSASSRSSGLLLSVQSTILQQWSNLRVATAEIPIQLRTWPGATLAQHMLAVGSCRIRVE